MSIIKTLFNRMTNRSQGPTKFVLLFQGRTGSTFLTDCANSHPQVKMDPEVWGGWGFQIEQDKIAAHVANQSNWLTHFYESSYPSSIKSIGFKTKLDDLLDKKHFITYLKDHDVKIVHLTRRNTVKLVISEINAQRLFDKSSTWNLEDERKRPSAFRLDLDKFHQQLLWREQIEKWLESYIFLANLPTIKLYYDDLLSDEKSFFETFYDFINVQYLPTKGRTFKNTPNDLQKIIINYDELLKRYKYTPYESMIVDA